MFCPSSSFLHIHMLTQTSSHLAGYAQQDAHEFFIAVLHGLHEHLQEDADGTTHSRFFFLLLFLYSIHTCTCLHRTVPVHHTPHIHWMSSIRCPLLKLRLRILDARDVLGHFTWDCVMCCNILGCDHLIRSIYSPPSAPDSSSSMLDCLASFTTVRMLCFRCCDLSHFSNRLSILETTPSSRVDSVVVSSVPANRSCFLCFHCEWSSDLLP